jgi:methylated-DNA-[protein]-cysteine S-methyltransferase
MQTETQTFYTLLESPIGALMLSGDASGLRGVHICNQKHAPKIESHWIDSESPFQNAIEQLQEYFAGDRTDFDLELNPVGTDFQQRVWQELCTIPFGKTCGYGDLAMAIGKPNAARAVGMANGRNPLSIIVPCHRVIGANGSLTGYGGGLPAKEWLLRHELNSSHAGLTLTACR